MLTATAGIAVAGAAGAGSLSLLKASAQPAADDFFEPEVRRSVNGLLDTTLTAKLGPVQIAGRQATSMVYDGMFPGPTLRIKGGDRLKVLLWNNLDKLSNLHVHGFHVSPISPGDNVLLHVPAGQPYQFDYQLPANHPPGLYWYHPHFHGDSDDQVWHGMAGAIVIEGAIDEMDGIKGRRERLLALQTTELEPDGTVTPTNKRSPANWMHLVNGRLNPTIRIRPGEVQRWRIANISSFTFFRLRLQGHEFHTVGQDGNPLKEVWTRDEIVLGAAERVEVLVRAGSAGSYQLQTLPFPPTGDDTPITLATMSVEGDSMPEQMLPTKLIPFEDLRMATPAVRRDITFQIKDINGANTFEISNRQFDEERVDQVVQRGDVEEWTIRNTSTAWHPFHIHINPFQVIAVNGQPFDTYSYEDTTPVPAGGSITMRTRFTDFLGKFVYHCHILPHEDAGMMGIVQVVDQFAPDGAGDPSHDHSTRFDGSANPFICDLSTAQSDTFAEDVQRAMADRAQARGDAAATEDTIARVFPINRSGPPDAA